MKESLENTNAKEIAPGVTLHKSLEKNTTHSNNILGIYTWRIEITTMSIVDFEVILDGSENIELIGNESKLQKTTQILPFETKDVAKIRLYKGYKLISKFKLILDVPDKKTQLKFIKNDIPLLQNLETKCKDKLSLIPLELLTKNEIDKAFISNKITKFVDFDFPPNDTSFFNPIYGDEIKESFEYLIHWRRPSDFILLEADEAQASSAKIIEGNDPEPNDIFINIFPDVNLSSALSAMAEKYNLIRRIFKSLDSSLYGIYQLQLYINGECKTYIVDDLFPCIPMNNPLVARSPLNEIWVLLIEKALAKAFDCYYSLLYLTITEFLLVLTGCPSLNFQIDEMIKENGTKGLTDKLAEFVNEKKFLTVAAINNERDQGEEDNSLVIARYGYTVLKLKEKDGCTFVSLRKVWYDDIKEDNYQNYKITLSEKYPSLESEFSEDTMILEIDDFVKEFSSLTVCYTKNWEEIRLRGRFAFYKENSTMNYEQCISEWFYSFNIDTLTNLVISIFQEEDKLKGGDSRKPVMDISLSILSYDSDKNEISHMQTIDFASTQNIQIELSLTKGNYIILPRSSGIFIGKPLDAPDKEKTIIYDKTQRKFTIIFENVIKDIFRRFDIEMKKMLSYTEFKGLYETMTKSSIEKNYYESQIAPMCQNVNMMITEKGLIQYFLNCYEREGEITIRSWLGNLGYSEDLYCEKNRCFVISVHSDKTIQLEAIETKNSEINSKVNRILLKKDGEVKQCVHKTVKPILFMSKISSIATLGCVNNSQQNLKVKLTVKNNNEIILGAKNGMERLIKAKETEYFCQLFSLYPDKIDNINYIIETQPI